MVTDDSIVLFIDWHSLKYQDQVMTELEHILKEKYLKVNPNLKRLFALDDKW